MNLGDGDAVVAVATTNGKKMDEQNGVEDEVEVSGEQEEVEVGEEQEAEAEQENEGEVVE